MLTNFDALMDGPGPRVVLGLPSVPSSPRAARSPRIGSTLTTLGSADNPPPDLMDVSNQPSMKVVRLPGGGVAIEIQRKVRYPGLVDDRDLDAMRKVGAQMIGELQGFSRGPLSRAELRRRRHPYGRGSTPSGAKRGTIRGIGRVKGIRGSVPDLSVVNKQSGAFEDAWSTEVELTDNGAKLVITSDTPYSGFLAFGTVKMRAHGPFTQVPVRFLSRINSAWQRAVRSAYGRKRMESEMLAQLGMMD